MEEIWKDVVDYKNIYEVSNFGNIRSKEGKVTYSDLHGKRVWKQRILKQKTDKDGYKRVELWKNKKQKTWLVHRLVANAFLQKEDGKDIINHIDGQPSNNNVSNLEWCNYQENLIHAFKNDLNQMPNQIILLDSETKTPIFFKSETDASKFLGKNHGYISSVLKRRKTKCGKFEIFVKAKDII